MRILLLLLVLTGVVCAAPADLAAYELGHELSLVALGRARGADAKALSNLTKKAESLASQLKVKIPPMPALKGKSSEDMAAGLHYLLKDTSPIVKALTKKQAALFEIGIKANCLLLLYQPGNDMGLVKVLQARGKTAGLSPTVFQPLADAVKKKVPQSQIQELLGQLHMAIGKSL